MEVVKRLVPKVPTDIVVFVISIALTVLALFVSGLITAFGGEGTVAETVAGCIM